MRSRFRPVLALLACAACVACARAEPERGPVARVERGPIERIVVATGTIEPENEVEVRPRVPGIVERISVEAGDRVEKDQVLVELERELLEAQVAEATAAVRAEQVERRFALIALERVVGMKERGATSQMALDDARNRSQAAAANLARAEARLSSLDVQLRYATIRSPIDGTVLDVMVEEGSAVSPVTSVTGGTLLLSLAGEESVHLEGLVDENEIAHLAEGQVARVTTEAYPDRVFAGRVAKIAPLGQRVQNVTYFEVEIAIEDEAAGLLRPRMSGDADIVTEVVEEALTVPETALRYGGEGISVSVIPNGDARAAESRPVKIGIVDGSRVQILEGVAEGDEVLLQ